MELLSHDILVIGGGLAGLRAAIEAKGRQDVAILSKVHPLRSHSVAAQGGINAALGNAPAPLKTPGKTMPLTRSKEAIIWLIRMLWR